MSPQVRAIGFSRRGLAGHTVRPGWSKVACGDPFHGRQVLVRSFDRPIHHKITLDNRAVRARGVGQVSGEIEMTLLGLAGFIPLETVMAKFDLREFPAGAPELPDKPAPII